MPRYDTFLSHASADKPAVVLASVGAPTNPRNGLRFQ